MNKIIAKVILVSLFLLVFSMSQLVNVKLVKASGEAAQFSVLQVPLVV